MPSVESPLTEAPTSTDPLDPPSDDPAPTENVTPSLEPSRSGPSALRRVGAAYGRFRRMGSARSVTWSVVHALGAVVAGLVLCAAVALVAWAVDPAPAAKPVDAFRLGLQGWFLAHGARISVPWGVLSLPPLAITAVLAYLLYRSGRRLARAADVRGLGAAAEIVVSVTIAYTLSALFLSSLAKTATVYVQPVSLAVAAAGLAAVGTGLGVLVESGLGHRLVSRLPGPGRAYLRGAVAGVLTLLATSAATVVVSLVVHSGQFAAVTRAATSGAGSGWVLAVLGVLYLPNAVVSALAFSTGAGFALGTGTTVSLGTIRVDRLPAFPLLAALPDGEGGSIPAWLSTVGPVVAGIVAAVVLIRSLDLDERGVRTLAGGALGTAVLVALLCAGLGLVASGSLGGDHLRRVGPVAWRTGLYAGAVLGTICALVVGLVVARGLVVGVARRSSRADRVTDPRPLVVDDEEITASVIDDDAEDADEDADVAADVDDIEDAGPIVAEPTVQLPKAG